jgi:AraC family transcriptional regulator, regulatory protein of adaptative response / DNA-3-methyladenine glycosylase II
MQGDSALDPETCERARVARDPRFDGRFFTGVRTTGVYCRPVCPVRPARPENVRFFVTAAAAASAGFRPCLRCRPEAAPGTPAWHGTSGTVSRAMRLIEEGLLDECSVAELASRLGMGSRHLSRLFHEHAGASPLLIAQTRRLHFAKRLLTETRLPMTEIAFASGYRSVRRFNDAMKAAYRRPPSLLRKNPAESASGPVLLRLGYRPPYDWPGMLAHLGRFATPGVESTAGGAYRRTLRIAGECAKLEVSPLAEADALALRLWLPALGSLHRLVARVRRVFDVDASPVDIASVLQRHEPLRKIELGLRFPGVWDGFELAVRMTLEAAVGRRRALECMRLLCVPRPQGGDADRLSVDFPEPALLLARLRTRTDLPEAAARVVKSVAAAASEKGNLFDGSASFEDLSAALKGVLPLTEAQARYLAARVLADPDVEKPHEVMGVLNPDCDQGLRQWMAANEASFRPWRSYAMLALAGLRDEAAPVAAASEGA